MINKKEKQDIIFSYWYITTISTLIYYDYKDTGNFMYELFLIDDKIHFSKIWSYNGMYDKRLWFLSFIIDYKKEDILYEVIHILSFYEEHWLNQEYDPFYEYKQIYKKIQNIFDF